MSKLETRQIVTHLTIAIAMAAFATPPLIVLIRNRASSIPHRNVIGRIRLKPQHARTSMRATPLGARGGRQSVKLQLQPRLQRVVKALRQFALLTWPLLVAAFYMCVVESWTILDGLYFATTVATTVGYGDLAPTTTAGRIFVAFYAVFCAARLATGLGQAVDFAASSMVTKGTSDDKTESAALRRLRATAIFLCAVLVIGCLLYARTLSLPPLDALYFVAVSASTVGLGDVSPQTRGGRLFATAWLVFAALGLANLLSRYAEWRAAVARRQNLQTLTEGGAFNEHAFRAMDDDADGRLTKAEFLGYVFCKLGVVGRNEVRDILRRFDNIDVDGSGSIDWKEVKAIENQPNPNSRSASSDV